MPERNFDEKLMSENLIESQYQELLTMPDLNREECMEHFPELVAYVLAHISLIDLLESQGVNLKPLSPDAPGVLIAEHGCPSCQGNIAVKE